jgi:hypothetical protein
MHNLVDALEQACGRHGHVLQVAAIHPAPPSTSQAPAIRHMLPVEVDENRPVLLATPHGLVIHGQYVGLTLAGSV